MVWLRVEVTAIHHLPLRAGTAVTPARFFATTRNFCAGANICARPLAPQLQRLRFVKNLFREENTHFPYLSRFCVCGGGFAVLGPIAWGGVFI
jgi:hypothetical protein